MQKLMDDMNSNPELLAEFRKDFDEMKREQLDDQMKRLTARATNIEPTKGLQRAANKKLRDAVRRVI